MSGSNQNIDDMQVFTGEIRLFAGDYTPQGWAECDGATLPVKGNEALYTLLNNGFGGDGKATFCLPDLRGRVVVGAGVGRGLTARTRGDSGGSAAVTLKTEEMPYHSHSFRVADQDGTEAAPDKDHTNKGVLANMAQIPGGIVATYFDSKNVDVESKPILPMASGVIKSTGPGQEHSNIMPSIGMRYIIALKGFYPYRP